MKTTVLIAGLVAALAATAIVAQDAATPDAAPNAAAPEASNAAPDAPVPGLSRDGDRRGRGVGVPNVGPLDLATYDADGNGSVTPEEVEARKAARFAQADADGNGGLSAEELVALDDIIRDEARASRAAAQVALMDDDADGLLQAAEIEARTPRVQPIFDQLDADGDGALSEAELAAARFGRGDGPGDGRGPDGLLGRAFGGHERHGG